MKTFIRTSNIPLYALALGICLALPGTLAAQTATPQPPERVELFSGYSFIDIDPDIEGVDSFGAQGFHVEGTRYLSRKLGIGVELTGHFGSTSTEIENIDNLDFSQFSFLVGPRLKSRSFWRIQLSSRGLVGISRRNFDIDSADDGSIGTLPVSESETNIAFALGGSLDLNLSERISLRLIQMNRFFTFFGDESQNRNRYSSGILVRF